MYIHNMVPSKASLVDILAVVCGATVPRSLDPDVDDIT